MSHFGSVTSGLANLFHIPRYLKAPFLLSILASALLSFSVLVIYFTVAPQLPFFYSLSQPQEYLARKEWLFLFPTLSWSVTLLHLFLLPAVKKYEHVIQQLFAWTAVIFQFLLCLALFRIINITT
jgi:hypothetical protein